MYEVLEPVQDKELPRTTVLFEQEDGWIQE